MGWVGDAVVAAVFFHGAGVNFGIGFRQNQFVASDRQIFGVVVLSVLLMVCAFWFPRRRPRGAAGAVPSAWITGGVAFVLGMAVMSTPPTWGWGAVGALVGLDAAFLCLVWMFSRRTAWTSLHTLSLGVGGALTYGVHAFLQKPLLGGLLWGRISNAVFLAAALWLIWLAARRVVRYQT
jgi:hypothetical protein